MYQGKTLIDMAQEIERQKSAKQDFVADTRKLYFGASNSEGEGETRLELRGDMDNPAQSFPITQTARRQIGAKVGIPAKYFDRMESEAPGLLADNVNHWLENEPKTQLVRVLDGRVRAFLSDKYQRIDHWDIASVAIPALQASGAEIVSCEITERRMYIKAVNYQVQGEVKVGQMVAAGTIVSNSETGQGRASVSPFVENLICTNGMVVNSLAFARNHVGPKTETTDAAYALLSQEAIAADDRAIILKMRDIIAGALSHAGFDPILNTMREAADPATRASDPAKAIETLAQVHTFTEQEQSGVLAHLIEGGDLTQWGIVNAITRTAADADNYDRATELETVGGTVLNLERSQWDRIAA
jgi:intracellular sulfur oxidation DsrE/DsrF family protein